MDCGPVVGWQRSALSNVDRLARMVMTLFQNNYHQNTVGGFLGESKPRHKLDLLAVCLMAKFGLYLATSSR